MRSQSTGLFSKSKQPGPLSTGWMPATRWPSKHLHASPFERVPRSRLPLTILGLTCSLCNMRIKGLAIRQSRSESATRLKKFHLRIRFVRVSFEQSYSEFQFHSPKAPPDLDISRSKLFDYALIKEDDIFDVVRGTIYRLSEHLSSVMETSVDRNTILNLLPCLRLWNLLFLLQVNK